LNSNGGVVCDGKAVGIHERDYMDVSGTNELVSLLTISII